MSETVSCVKTLSNGARMLRALMRAAGTHRTRDLVELTGCHPRMIQRWKTEISDTGVVSEENDRSDKRDKSDTGVATNATKATPVSHSSASSREYDSACERARFESPSEIVVRRREEEKKKNPPTPRWGALDDRPSISADDPFGLRSPCASAGVSLVDERIVLDDELTEFWLARFGGDDERLALALVEAAASVRLGSRQAIRQQVERVLARIAGEKRDRDARYASAATRGGSSGGKPQPTAAELDERRRRDREVDEIYRQQRLERGWDAPTNCRAS